MGDLSKSVDKANKAKAKAAKEMHKAATALRDWFRVEREAGRLHPNSLEGRDTRLTLARELEEFALFTEGQLESAQQRMTS